MQPRIETITEKKLIGKHIRTTFSENKIFFLWRSFMPRRKEIKNIKSPDLYSMNVYDEDFDVNKITNDTELERWAAIEVTDIDSVPEEMDSFILRGGLYAVFLHKGAASTGPITFKYIYGTWLPGSGYVFDARPQFEVLGEKYKNEDPDSEEEIWIPIRHR